MPDTPPWLEYQAGPTTVPLGPAKPKEASEGYRWTDATHTRMEPIPGGPHDPASKGDSLSDDGLTGEAFLKTVPPQYRNMVKLYAANKLIPPARPSDTTQKIISAAAQYDPEYDPALAPNRKKAIQDFTGRGSGSLVIQAVNRLASHLSDMWDASEKMGGPNLGIRPLNKLIASVQQQGEPTLVAKYDAAKPFVATELDKIMKGTGQTTVSGIQEAVGALDRARSLDERRAALKQISSLVHGALDPVKQGWDSAYGGTKAPPMWVSPKAAAVFGKIDPDNAGTFGGDDWRGLPGLKGDGTPGQGTGPGSSGPPVDGGGAAGGRHITGSNALYGEPTDNLEVATGAFRTERERSPDALKLSAMLSAGSPSANIRAYARAHDYPMGQVEKVLAWRATNQNYKGGYDVHQDKIVPQTAWNQWSADPRRAGALAAVDAGTFGLTDEATGAVNSLRTGQPLSESIASADYAKQNLMDANPKAALTGSVIGGGAAMIGGGLGLNAALRAGAKGGLGRNVLAWAARNPLKAATLGDTGYGIGYGVGENNDNRTLGGVVGGVTAPIASVAGQLGTRALGAGLRGVNNAAVDRLRTAGIPLTVGEVLGGQWKKAQDAMTSVFGPGNMVARRYGEGREALNKAAFNEAGQVIDTPINQVGQPGIEALNTAKSRAYSNALDPIELNLNNPQFTQSMQGALAAAKKIPGAELPEGYGGVSIRHYVGNQVSPDGTMTGPGFQKAYRGLAQTASKAAPKIEGHDIGEAVGQAKDALTTALQEQNPGAYADFLKANSANRHLSILADAVNAAKNQVDDKGNILFTPAQLGQAATANAKTYGGKIAAASGDRPFNVLARDAQQVMSSKLPDSGTPARLLAMGLATGGALGGGGVGYGAGGGEGAVEGAAVPLLALSALGTRRGQQLLTAALLKRVAPFRIAGKSKALSGPLGGDILASLGIPLAAGE